MTAKQHTAPRKPLFPRVVLTGKNPAAEKTVNPAHTAESVPLKVPDYMTPVPPKKN